MAYALLRAQPRSAADRLVPYDVARQRIRRLWGDRQMVELTEEDREELVRVHHQTFVAALVVVAALVGALVLIIASDADAGYRYVGGGGGIGILIGFLLTIPRRRLHARLGITGLEATMILEAERDRRTGRDQIPDEVRAEAAAGRRRLLYGLGGLASAGFVVALVYAVDKGGQTYVEGESSAPLVIAVFGGFGMLIAAVLCFVAAYAINPDGTPRRSRTFDPDPDDGPSSSDPDPRPPTR